MMPRVIPAVFDDLEIGITLHDPETGEIRGVNERLEELYGYTAAQLREMEVGEYSVGDDGFTQAEAERRIRAAASGEPQTFEWHVERSDGETVWVRVRLAATTLDGEDYVIAEIRDSTERKERKQELAIKSQAIEEAPVGITLTDAEQDDNPLIYANETFTDLVGYSDAEISGWNHRELQGKATSEAAIDEFRTAIDTEESTTVELRNYTKDGELFWNRVSLAPLSDETDTVTNWVGFQEDVTDQKQREQKLEAERLFIQQSLDTLEDVFYMIDTDGHLERWNDSFAEVTGYTDTELSEMHALDFFPEEQQTTISETITDVLESGSAVVEAEYLTKGGQRIPYEFTGTRFTDAEGTVQGIIGIGRDVTDRKAHLRTVKKQEQAVRHLHETASKSAPFEEKIEELLEFGREYMGVEQGNFTLINEGVQEIVIPVGDSETNQPGDMVPLSESYCRHTIEETDPGPFTVQDAVEEGWQDDSAYKQFGQACYAGAPVTVDQEIVGTVCFFDRNPHEGEFTEIQKAYVNLLAEWASYELDRVERERTYRRLTERITSGYYAIDTDWNFTYWNDVMEQRQGISAEENVGENIWEQYPEIEDSLMGETLREAMESGEETTCEFYYETMDYWTKLQVYPDEDGISVLSTNITERKEHEQELRRSQTLMRQTERLASTGGWAVNLTNESQHWTDGTREIHDVDQAFEPTLEHGLRFFHPDDQERIQHVFERCIEAGEPYDEELRILTDDDKLRWVRTRGELTPDDETEYDAWGVIQDITDRKEREQDLERSNERLEQFAYVASHDLQEPLRTISNYIELVAEEYGEQLDAEAEEFIDTVVTSSQRMQSMLNGLLDFSRVTTRGQAFEPVDADQLVVDLIKDVQFMLDEHDGTVNWENLPTVAADPSQLRQVFQNLVTNALEHAGDGPVSIDIRATETDNGYQFEVEDDGDGIAANRQEKIFRIFKSSEQDQTTEQARGIGLAICENIVARHGGEIWVDSELGEGSRFVFTIEDI